MFFVVVVNNLWAIWIAIEMTTLISAFLVGFYNTKTSVEAAWKYLIICSVGITLALFGTLLFYYCAAVSANIHNISWIGFCEIASKLDPKILKIGFLFIMVGYGTKAGLVPMHTWLPDAHSQSPAPISALLSGVLLKTAIYSVLRFAIIVNKCIGPQFTGNLFIIFGIISLGVSAGFILIQKDIKRLLAYSSVEHIGIISIGLGYGSILSLYGALLHVFNHAVTKSLMFFGAGNITKKYNTNNMNIIKGVIKVIPFTGILVFLGVFALAGSPPFSIFMSEIMIIIAGFHEGKYAVTLLFILFTVVIFAAIVHHFSKMLLGKRPENISVYHEPFFGKIAFICLLFFIIYIGFQIPWIMDELLQQAVGIINSV
jgi:hydrogenase-4 component F